MKRLPKMNQLGLKGCFIAGGSVLSAITKSQISDFDVYPKSIDDAVEICETLLDDDAFVVNITDKCITFKHNQMKDDDGKRFIVQVVLIDEGFKCAEQIFETFDFSVCMAAYDCDTGEHFFSDDFWPDVASRTIRYNPGTRFPLASLIRLAKYREKGYKGGKGEYAKIALSIAEKLHGIDNWKELESQLGGVYGRSLEIKTKDRPFTFETAYEVLSDLEVASDYTCEADYSETEITALECIIRKSPVYEHGYNQFFFDGDRLVFLNQKQTSFDFNIRPIEECPVKEIKIYKVLKKTGEDGVYQGGMYYGNHNDVKYEIGKETRYEKFPYLYAFTTKPLRSTIPTAMGYVKLDDLVENTTNNKIQAKAITLTEWVD